MRRIYQQTFIDMYSAVAFAKLYSERTPVTAAELLISRVLPFVAERGIRLSRVLTDRGSEYGGMPDRHLYELYLIVEGIEQKRAMMTHPQAHPICERFNEAILEQFYQAAFRRSYETLEQLQSDCDAFVDDFNRRPSGQRQSRSPESPMESLLVGLRDN